MFGVWIGVRGCYSVSPCVLLIYEEIKGRARCTIRLISSMVLVQYVLKIIRSSGCNSPSWIAVFSASSSCLVSIQDSAQSGRYKDIIHLQESVEPITNHGFKEYLTSITRSSCMACREHLRITQCTPTINHAQYSPHHYHYHFRSPPTEGSPSSAVSQVQLSGRSA